MDCIFCNIVAGKIPSYKVYEDEDFLAFLNIYPKVEGHTLVIPKKHVQWVWDVDNSSEYMAVCRKIAKHYQKITKNEMVCSFIFGEAVPHAHIHLLPCLESGEMDNVFSALGTITKPPLSEDKGKKIAEMLRVR